MFLGELFEFGGGFVGVFGEDDDETFQGVMIGDLGIDVLDQTGQGLADLACEHADHGSDAVLSAITEGFTLVRARDVPNFKRAGGVADLQSRFEIGARDDDPRNEGGDQDRRADPTERISHKAFSKRKRRFAFPWLSCLGTRPRVNRASTCFAPRESSKSDLDRSFQAINSVDESPRRSLIQLYIDKLKLII